MRVCMLLHKPVRHDSRVRREARALQEMGCDVTVVVLADEHAAPEGEPFAVRSACPDPWFKQRLPFHVYRLVFLLSFVRWIVKLRPHVVHAHDAAMLVPGLIGARLCRARLVYDSHELATSVPYRERGWASFVGLVERLVVGRCDAVMTVSDGIAARLHRRYGLASPPVVVRNVSDLQPSGQRAGLRARLAIGDEPLILHQGAAAPGRGCETLVQALARLEHGHVVFLGDGEPGWHDRIAALASAAGVAHRVHFHPSVELGRLLDHTAEADIGVSLLEDTCENHRLALPNKVFEYVAAGVPVVTSALPELEALVRRYGIGWTVAPGSPEALAVTLRDALAQASDDDVRRRVRRAADELHWRVEATRLTGLYAVPAVTNGRSAGPNRRRRAFAARAAR
jgi:glycosyltransferase involved in cell wall biosynthesis